MKRLEKIISDERNVGLDFIVHIQNKNELEDLIEVLTKLEFEIQLSLKEQTLREWMEELAEEENYDTCFRIRNRADDRCIAYNPSVEHWRMFYNDILEISNGNLEYNEGYYTREAAEIETEKVWKAINDEEYGKDRLQILGLKKGISKEEILQWVLRHYNKDKAKNKVKWFNNKLGYGFVTNGNENDVFVHYSNIVSEKKFKKLYKGQNVCFDILETDRGLQAVNVTVC